METDNNQTNTQPITEETPKGELKQCSVIKKNRERCGSRFRTEDHQVTACAAHRDTDAAKNAPVPDERAVGLPLRNPDQQTFRVNVGKTYLRENQEKLKAIIVAFTDAAIGFGAFNNDAFGTLELGTNESAVIMRSDAAQFVVMAIQAMSAGWLTEIEGNLHTVRISVIEDPQWGPKIIRNLCGACWNGSPQRACDLDKPNSIGGEQRWVVKVAIIAEQNGVRLDEVTDEMLSETSLCSFHARMVNQRLSEQHKRRVEIYSAFSNEKKFLDRLHANKANRARFADEAAQVVGADNLATLAEIAIANADRRHGRRNGDPGQKGRGKPERKPKRR